MTETTISRTYVTREEWLAARRTLGIGSSDAPVILGLSKYKSPLALYHEKIGTFEGQQAAHADDESEFQYWGRVLERPIAERYAFETGRVIDLPTPGAFTIHQNIERPWMVASLDGEVFEDRLGMEPGPNYQPLPAPGRGVLEIKNVSQFLGDLWETEPPLIYQVQAQHQMAVTGRKWASLAGLVGGNNFRWADILRDEEFIAALIAAEQDFMRRVVERDPPPADGTEATQELLKRLYPHDNGLVIELPPEFIDADAAREKGIELEKQGKALRDEAEAKIKAAIGENTGGALRDGTVFTWKPQSRRALCCPSCATEVQAEAKFRVLRRAGAKGKK